MNFQKKNVFLFLDFFKYGDLKTSLIIIIIFNKNVNNLKF